MTKSYVICQSRLVIYSPHRACRTTPTNWMIGLSSCINTLLIFSCEWQDAWEKKLLSVNSFALFFQEKTSSRKIVLITKKKRGNSLLSLICNPQWYYRTRVWEVCGMVRGLTAMWELTASKVSSSVIVTVWLAQIGRAALSAWLSWSSPHHGTEQPCTSAPTHQTCSGTVLGSYQFHMLTREPDWTKLLFGQNSFTVNSKHWIA